MTRISKLSVTHFRSHEQKDVSFRSNTAIIIGRNGAGKTSLLEAVYVALRGRSFKGTDSEILQHNQPWWRIELEFNDGAKRSVTFNPEKTSGQKNFTVNEKKTIRLSPKDKLPVVLFDPTDLQLLHGSPSRRRDFIDHLISQVDPSHSTTLGKYERALRQRNNLLRRGISSPDQLFAWDVALSEYGAGIVARRARMAERINDSINSKYKSIVKNDDNITVTYSHSTKDSTPQKILQELERNKQKDIILKHTSVGPHRHDVLFGFNGSPAASTTSRGETRSIVIALKYIERDIIKDVLNIDPIVLLDDVFSELDEARQEQLTIGEGQHIITTTHLPFEAKKVQKIKL